MTGKPASGLSVWIIVSPVGVEYVGLHNGEDETWESAMGWPHEADMKDRKSRGWYAARAELSWPKLGQEERLAQVTNDAITTFNESKLVNRNGGLLSWVNPRIGLDRRRAQIKRCIKVARDICREEYESTIIVRQFWVDYWQRCFEDPFTSGRNDRPANHSNWKPDLEYLTRPVTMLRMYDKEG